MSESFYILDTALPLNQDFRALKNEGLALIQQYSGSKWTNLNSGDPGITILDQLCYALTELGYCNDFDIKDILTSPDGKLETDNQFYLPQQILTTSPVTVDDYRKYLIDGITGIDNVVIEPLSAAEFFSIPVYKVYLHINKKDWIQAKDICKAAFFCLNQSRNLGELFLVPEALTPVEFSISGHIEIEKDADQYTVLQQVTDKINNYIFPKVMPGGYYSLSNTSADTDKTWNGPLLNNGYILTDTLGTKKDCIRVIDIVPLLMQVPGVTAVSQLSFSVLPYLMLQELSCTKQEILTLNAVQTVVGSQVLKIKKGGHTVALRAEEIIFPPVPGNAVSEINLVYGKTLDADEALPVGTFRDINTYYSIQNTFPAIFAVGATGTVPNASAFQEAQSRQLKGYLTLFDQVLANQFSQLANIDKLFSFKNSLTGAPSDFAALMNLKSPYERAHETIPVPYMAFSPAYFYQSLYGIPDIKPLLKNNDAFNFSYAAETTKEAEYHSWKAYTEDPYNAYMSNLMRLMQNADTDLERRNNILDHLLARHGESPLVINAYINDPVYSGNVLQDKVIIKSLYLQNYGLLSYNRQKACNFFGADKLAGWREQLTPITDYLSKQYDEQLLEGNTIDFIFNSGKINEVEKISPANLVNYAAVELKLSLLFALKIRYHDFIIQNFEKARTHALINNELHQAWWLITYRRGCIMIETALLYSCLQPQITITADPVNGPWYAIKTAAFKNTGFNAARNIYEMLMQEDKVSIAHLITNKQFSINEESYRLDTLYQCTANAQSFMPINTTGYFIASILPQIPGHLGKQALLFEKDIIFIFPDFIPLLNKDELKIKSTIDLFLQTELPVTCSYCNCYCGQQVMGEVIDRFVDWHNSMRFVSANADSGMVQNSADRLINILTEILPS